jgi:hypothetical protein
MLDELNEKELKILNYLKSLSKNGNKRIEFYMNDAISLTQMQKEEFEEVLISLEEKGFLKIVKVPSSKNFLDLIKKKLLTLDATFLTGQISREEYTKKWEEIINIISDPKFSLKYPILPLAELPDIIDGLNNIIGHIEKLRQEKENIKKEIFEKLVKDYNEELHETIDTILRYIDSIIFAIEMNKKIIEVETREIETIEIDEKIRNVNRSEEKNMKLKNISKAKSTIEVIAKKIAIIKNEHIKEKINTLEKDLEKLKEEYEIMQARAIIENDETLRKSAEDLHNTILSKQRSLHELKETEKKDVKEVIEKILQKANYLFNDKLLTEDNTNRLTKIKINFEKIVSEIEHSLSHENDR